MRVLEQKKIAYTPHSYPHGDSGGRRYRGQLTGLAEEKVFKTLCPRGSKRSMFS